MFGSSHQMLLHDLLVVVEDLLKLLESSIIFQASSPIQFAQPSRDGTLRLMPSLVSMALANPTF
jgi:hypothetical protein